MLGKINFNGLKFCARKFEEDGRIANGRHWSIATGGYDLLFEIYYDHLPVAGYIRGDGFSNYGHLNDTEMNRLMHTVCLEVSGIKEILIKEELSEEEKEFERTMEEKER